MSKLNEKQIIDMFISKLWKNNLTRSAKDDVAVIQLPKDVNMRDTHSIILTCDMLVESTDVPAGAMRPWQIARKSIVASISDLSSKGIRPYASLVSIGLPKKYSKGKIENLICGFHRASKEFGFKIVGGDTNESSELVIDCSMIGFANSNTHIPTRNGAKPRDLIVVSGEFGYSPSGLKILEDHAKAQNSKFKNKAISSVTNPKPPQLFGSLIARHFSSSMDCTDGLAITLYELARQSKVNFLIDNIPSVKDVKEFAHYNHLDIKDLIFYGGEEYEIVATINPSKLEKVKSIAKRSKLKLFVVGRVEKGEGKVFVINEIRKKYSELEERGYIHFANSL
jgi:thiamine-monophosphate kinase